MDKLKVLLGQVAETGIDAVGQAISDWQDTLIQEAAEEERKYAINCAAAALVDAQQPDTKIAALLRKYYRIDEHEAAATLGEGRLIASRKRDIEKARQKRKEVEKKK